MSQARQARGDAFGVARVGLDGPSRGRDIGVMSDPMAVLRERFLERTQATLSLLLHEDRESAEVQPAVHKLSGAAGVFGFHEVSRLAGIVDDALHAGERPRGEDLDNLIDALRKLPVSAR